MMAGARFSAPNVTGRAPNGSTLYSRSHGREGGGGAGARTAADRSGTASGGIQGATNAGEASSGAEGISTVFAVV
jgi:hypothetical protein